MYLPKKFWDSTTSDTRICTAPFGMVTISWYAKEQRQQTFKIIKLIRMQVIYDFMT
jgi:hypothetical protein